ncbi:TetR/AcrR family transcriptional regulator C-terminal domain-containing protein [Micromonospora purpureochromogenes]|uniref:TetR/AcrR family transcriptional regulator C-terminal domain-containing protein n=1 Tax=Micromonospora purpureochromogenes TaxID=47872 RepID=UPI002F912CB1
MAAQIRLRIELGELRPGDPVPSARQITREHGVAIATATKVLALLREEGLVLARPGAGTVVAARPDAPPRAGRSDPELSRDHLVRTAMALADSDGLAAVSLRRLAADLGVATMALHRHVRGRDELVRLMADSALADALPTARPAGWRAQLELLAREQWRVYRRHRWLPHVISMSRPQLLPRGMAHTEWALRATGGVGLDRETRWYAALTLIAQVRGVATNLEMQAQAEQDTGLTDEEWIESQEPVFDRLAPGRYPTLAALSAEGDVDLTLDGIFEFGLRRLLDSYATLIEDAARRPG